MPDINFKDFNPRSFEQFAQALAAAILGPGILIFGDGPDGGREAAFEGIVPYPNRSSPWNGKIVMQAKFRQNLHGGARDIGWLIKQLQVEAKKYSAGGRPLPDHYIFVTNIRLSGVCSPGRRGGQERLRAAFERYLSPLGVTSFDIWHEEKIATLLDLYPDLFRSYGAWLGNREVLAAVYRSFESQIPNFGMTMLLYLQRELRSQRGTRLQQAGHVNDGPTHLESVFIDLPYNVKQESPVNFHHLRDLAHIDTGGNGILHALLTSMSLKMDPITLSETWKATDGPSPNRHLVLGGPGQGKSTITQFLGQVMRFRLLRAEPITSLSLDTQSTLSAIGERLEKLDLPIDGVRRYPIRVDLPLFADGLTTFKQDGNNLSLLEFMARGIATVASTPSMNVTILRDWLGRYPFLVMLDGLDEVPPSGARREVIAAIVEFWDEVAARNADVAMTVTTRPQGYNDDLDPALHVRLEMTRLDQQKALAYAERVAYVKLSDPERRSIVLSRLATAARNEATAMLMVSPLQVAILFQLVDQRGTAPTDRWTLFYEYLSIVIKREQEKTGQGGELVRAHETLIRRLLGRVGLLLHVEAEHGGGANAYLDRCRLEGIAVDLLEEEEFDVDELKYLSAGIVTAATDRLVFLEQRTEGRIEFDVRSLQEFMAAAELMTGEDGAVRARLREIAGRTHWQHVYRIAASKAFAAPDEVKFRDTILCINRELDDESGGSRALRRGAAMSLDLLADGLATGQPRFRRMLFIHALELLSTGQGVDRRFVAILRAVGETTTCQVLGRYISSLNRVERRGAWALIVGSVEESDDWVDRLGQAWWPTEKSGQLDAIACGAIPKKDSGTDKLLTRTISNTSPLDIYKNFRICRSGQRSFSHVGQRYPFLLPLLDRTHLPTFEVEIIKDPSINLRADFLAIDGDEVAALFDAPQTNFWDLFARVYEFVVAPSVETAVGFTKSLTLPGLLELANVLKLPWLLSNLCMIIGTGLSPDEVSASLIAGVFGDKEAWTVGQNRLIKKGMSENDLEYWKKGLLIGQDFADVGMPYPDILMLSGGSKVDSDWISLMLEAVLIAPSGPTLRIIKRILRFVSPRVEPALSFSAREWLALFGDEMASERWIDPDSLALIQPLEVSDPVFLDFVASLGELGRVSLASRKGIFAEWAQTLLASSDREGVLVVALAMVAGTGIAVSELALSLKTNWLTTEPTTIAARAAVATLKLASGLKGNVADLTPASGASIAQHALLSLADAASPLNGDLEEAVAHLAMAAVDADDVRTEALRVLKASLDQRQSELHIKKKWQELALPKSLYVRLLIQKKHSESLLSLQE